MNPPVIHVVTPESSSGNLWAEVQRLQAVEAESARTIAHLNQAHREVSEMQKARIEELENALRSREEADNAWRDGTMPHEQCHALTDKAREMTKQALAKSAGIKPEAL